MEGRLLARARAKQETLRAENRAEEDRRRREIAAKNGWTEPVADKAADQAPTKASKASTKASNKKGVKAK